MFAYFVSVFILVSSGLLLLFWLRSAAQSVLRQRFEQDYSAEVAEANQLEYLAIREALTYLLRNAATVHVGRYSRTERLLIMDFQLLRLWVRLKRLLGWPSWRSGLLEVATILEDFGNVVGHRLVTFPSRVSGL